MKKKTSNVPVFLIYAGIIHAIGLALLMPMLITLPGPGGAIVPEPTAIDVEIIPGTSDQARIEASSEQTSALPSVLPSAEEDAAVKADDGGEAVANVSPDAEAAVKVEPAEAKSPAEEATTKDAPPAKAKPRGANKPVAHRSRTAKPAVKRTAKTATKIAPFNGALTGLFTPGAPANNRRR